MFFMQPKTKKYPVREKVEYRDAFEYLKSVHGQPYVVREPCIAYLPKRLTNGDRIWLKACYKKTEYVGAKIEQFDQYRFLKPFFKKVTYLSHEDNLLESLLEQ